MKTFHMYGSLFENLIIADAYKTTFHDGERPDFHFFRDGNGTEVDLIFDTPAKQILWEIKGTQTYHPRLTRTMRRVASDIFPQADLELIYGGDEAIRTNEVKLRPWSETDWSL